MARQDALLNSINDRLGALCERFGATQAGADIAPLNDRWLDDLREYASWLDDSISERGGF